MSKKQMPLSRKLDRASAESGTMVDWPFFVLSPGIIQRGARFLLADLRQTDALSRTISNSPGFDLRFLVEKALSTKPSTRARSSTGSTASSWPLNVTEGAASSGRRQQL